MSGCLICKIQERKFLKENFKSEKIYNTLFLLNAFLCLVWLLVRSGTKPSRIRYPCQRYALSQVVAVPIFAGFLNFAKINERINGKISLLIPLGILLILMVSLVSTTLEIKKKKTLISEASSSNPGLCQEYFPINNGRSKVVEIYDSLASNYPYNGDNYFNYINQGRINLMLEEGIKKLAGKSDINDALRDIFPNYQTGKAIAIKVNGNDFVHNFPLNYYNTEPQVVRALVSKLVSFGINQEDIWIVEGTGENTSDSFPNYFTNIIKGTEYSNIKFYRKGGPSGYDCISGKVTFSYTVPYSPRCSYSCITSAITQATYFVDIPIIKAIRTKWGITGAIKSMQGVTNNQYCHHDPNWNQSNMEPLDLDNPTNPLVSIYSNPNIKDKKRLIISSGILGNWTGFHFDSDNTTRNLPNPFVTKGSKPLNTILFSFDPVAIDSVALNIIGKERVARALNCVNASMLKAAAKAGLGTFEVFKNGSGIYSLINYEFYNMNQPDLRIESLRRGWNFVGNRRTSTTLNQCIGSLRSLNRWVVSTTGAGKLFFKCSSDINF